MTLQNINLKKDYKNRDKLDFTRWNQDQQAIETAVNKFISSVTSGDSGADSLSMTPIEDISTDNKVQTFLKSLVTLLLSQVVADYGKLGLAKVLAKIDGTGGSNIVGSKSIIGVSGNTVFDQIKSLKALIDQIEEGVLPDDYIDNTKLANDVKVGSLAALATVDKSAVTAAINEVLGNVGDIENLETANKTSVVGAVNEVKGDIGDKSTLNTDDKNSIVAAINELFTYANDGKTGEANAIGTPALSTDSFATLNGLLQSSKDTLAANLTDKGQVSTGSETLAALVAKVADVYTGRKSAFGKENYSISAGGADVTIALPFTPGFVAITYSYRGSALYRVSYHGFDSADADKSLSDSWGGDYTAAGISMQSSGFTIGASSSYPITVYNWIACEQLNV